ncbi:MAG: four-carbon acid sugar kinase family protein [Chloroflexota bacterium]
MYPELGILADDLTGATDSGLQFAKCGRRTHVSLSWTGSSACDVLVFDSDSRARTPAEARERVLQATRKLRAAGTRRFYKKIDSTARGNLGIEIEAMLEALELAAALICPAFPDLGRTVRQGDVHVQGIPLDRSEFARDPLWPATTSSLAEILRRQTFLPIASLPLNDVRRGPAHLRVRIEALLAEGARLIVGDAESPNDLRGLVEALRQTDRAILPVGSAGLAEWLGGSLASPARPPREIALSREPILLVAGTVSQTGLVQLGRLVESGVKLVRLPPDEALGNPESTAHTTAIELVREFRDGGCVALALVNPTSTGADPRLAVAHRGLAPGLATERLVGALGRTTVLALARVCPAAMILTGGDTARAVCAALGANGLDVHREAAPGVPICLLEGGRWDGLPVVTKAGGFGAADTLTRVVKQLEEMRR